MKQNTIGNKERNILQKMFSGFELFHWSDKTKTVHLRKMKSGEFGTTGETVKKSLFADLITRGLVSKSEFKAGRTFYVLTDAGKKLCK